MNETATTSEEGGETTARDGTVGAAVDVDGTVVLVKVGELGLGTEGARKRGSNRGGAEWVEELGEESWSGDPSKSHSRCHGRNCTISSCA